MKPVTLSQVAEHYRGTALTPSAIRRAVVSGEVHSIRVGRKYLTSIEAVESWLRGETTPKPTETVGGIRRVGG